MTKLEALAKDCIENHTHRLVDKPTKQDVYLREESIFIQGYRQSEKRIADIEKENTRLKEKWLQATDDGTSWAHLKSLERENAELKLKLEALEGETPWKDIKDKSEVIGQLTKATEIIKKFWEFVNDDVEFDPEYSQEHIDMWNELCEQAEQFLSEVVKL